MPYNAPPEPNTRLTLDITSDPLESLRRANAKESYHWLEANAPDHFDAVTQAVGQGVTPDEIYRTVLRDTFRQELAHRCRLAARWLTGR